VWHTSTSPHEPTRPDHIAAVDDGVLVHWAGFASYDLRFAGTEGTVEVRSAVPLEEAAMAFVFSVLPLALPVLGIEPLHGSAVRSSEGAVLLLGPSGAGKSSLAAALDEHGMPFLSDDTCALDRHLDLWPGPPVLSPRWSEAPQRPIGEYNEKLIRLPSRVSSGSTKPGAVICLSTMPGVTGRFEDLTGVAAFRAVLSNARHPDLHVEGRRELQMRVASEMTQRPVVSLTQDPTLCDPATLAQQIVDWLAANGLSAFEGLPRRTEPPAPAGRAS
jgi:hypothetical protein